MLRIYSLPVTILLIALSASEADSQGFRTSPHHSLYSDHKARDIGDVITIMIIEFSEADNQSAPAVSKSDEISISTDDGLGALSFLPDLSFGASTSNAFSGEGSTTRRGSLRGKMTATIKEIMPNGYFRVEGKRVIEINQDKQEMKLTGIVRPRDIRADNTVLSYNIAEANIKYSGKGTLHNAQRIGFVRRIINWIF